MQFVWRRYARSGYAPPLFYYVAAAAFIGLAAWAGIQGDWTVMALAIVMAPVTYAGSRVMRRLRDAERTSRDEIARAAAKAAEKDRRDG